MGEKVKVKKQHRFVCGAASLEVVIDYLFFHGGEIVSVCPFSIKNVTMTEKEIDKFMLIYRL